MNQYLETMQPWIDQNGLIAMKDGDEGDSCAREALFAVCIRELYDQGKINMADYLLLRKRYWENTIKLSDSQGTLKRGLIPNSWVSQSDGIVMSRDQWYPSVIAFGSLDLKGLLNYMFFGHLFHRGLLFTSNTCPNWIMKNSPQYRWKFPDVTLLDSWGIYIRAYKAWILYPFLFLFDLPILVQSLILIYNSFYNPNSTSDVPNHLCSLIQAKRRMPTLITWIARKLLNFCKNGIQTQVDNYFTPQNGSPPFGEIFKAILPNFL